jgi:hypothetical protein
MDTGLGCQLTKLEILWIGHEVDDSSGYLGMFGDGLFARWVTARQAVSADPADTVARLLRWMARDQYGFWSHVEDDVASALDEAGRAACAGHLKRLLDTGTEPAFIQRQIDTLLRAVYIAQRDAGAYIALAERSGLTAKTASRWPPSWPRRTTPRRR